MSSKTVLKMGESALQEKSKPVTEFACTNLYNLIQELKATMLERGGIGIAAPQIGFNLRVMIFGFESSHRYPNEKSIPFTTLINPEITMLSEEMSDGWEGCLSIPGLRGLVPRYNSLRYTGFNEEGEKIERIVDGFHARVVQHECDHLNGILFPQRIKDMRQFGFEDVLWEKIYGTTVDKA